MFSARLCTCKHWHNPWPGWDKLLPYLKAPLSVLDVGCGNGRFGVFLAQHLEPEAITYYGIDHNAALLERARAALNLGRLRAELEDRDIVLQPPDTGAYDLVGLFGVLHHIPGSEHRRSLMRTLAQRVKPGGLLAFAAWRFYDFARFRERIVPWPDDLDVEPGDYLLDWRRGEHTLRYCHYVNETEHAELVKETGLVELITYRADGRTHDINCYSLLRKEKP